MTRAATPLSLRAYETLLLAYPRRFRDLHGRQMRQHFLDCLRDSRRDGSLGLASFWLHTLSDLVATALPARAVSGAALLTSDRAMSNLAALAALVVSAFLIVDGSLELDDTIWNGSDPFIEATVLLPITLMPLALLGLARKAGARGHSLERKGHRLALASAALGLTAGAGALLYSGFGACLLGAFCLLASVIACAMVGTGRVLSRKVRGLALRDIAPAVIAVLGIVYLAGSPGNSVPWWGNLPTTHFAYRCLEIAWGASWFLLALTRENRAQSGAQPQLLGGD